MQFFVPYGHKAFWGIALITLLFAGLGMAVLQLTRRFQLKSYQDMVNYLLGRRIGQAIDGVITVFLFLGLCIMLAGSGAIFEEHLGSTAELGIGLAVVCLVVVLAGEVKGVVWFNSLLVPLKFLICLGVSLTVVVKGKGALPTICPGAPDLTPVSEHWVLASILYVSYNMVLGTVILVSLGDYVSRSGSLMGAAWGGAGLGLFALAIVYTLQINYPAVTQYEVPMLYIAACIHPFLKYFYAVILWIGILTTALVNAYGFAKRLTALSGMPYMLNLGLTMVLAIPFAQYRFSILVGTIYPLFGYIGLALLGGLLIRARQILK